MWKQLLILILSLASIPAFADIFRVQGKLVEFVELRDGHLHISASCASKKSEMQCDAYKALAKLSFKKLRRLKVGGVNPGSLLCTQQTSGTVVIGEDTEKNENSFCRFKDGSQIDTGSLVYFATSNDEKSP